MRSKFEGFLSINFDNYNVPDYLSEVEKQRFNDSVVRMLEMQKLIKKSVDIANTSEIPLKLVESLEGIIDDYQEMKNLLDASRIPKENYSPNNTFNRIHSTHANFFEPSSSNKTLMTINAISNYEFFFDEKSIKRLDQLNDELNEKNKRVDEILKKLENPSAEKVLADYAAEYAKEETYNNDRSLWWLIGGIFTTILFIALVVLSILYEWFPSKLKLENVMGGVNKTYEIINVPVLVTKVMLASLIIYFIVFCFRQYSIYKHLAIVNQQKKNAFNSYTLFAAAVGEKDLEAKKILLMSLARTIHESINSGFLPSKQSEPPLNQNFDLGKLTSGNP